MVLYTTKYNKCKQFSYAKKSAATFLVHVFMWIMNKSRVSVAINDTFGLQNIASVTPKPYDGPLQGQTVM